jgi:mannose-6-phosphate isomerase-like protein (cupin superfamily)
MQKTLSLTSHALRAVLVAGVIGAAPITPAAYAQDKAAATESPPLENVGLSAKLLGEIPLKDEFTEVGSRALRMRLLTVEKGGVIGLHNHVNRPSVEYVLSGSAVEIRDGKETPFSANDQIVADHTTEHYWRNTGDGPLTILAVDIYEPKP